jgi:TolB-like protein
LGLRRALVNPPGGFTEELINLLARISELRVIAGESSLRLKRTTLTSEEIGRRLRVRVLVMGTIRRTSGRLRVIARLVKAEDGLQLWSDSYEGDEKDLLDIEGRLAGAIASAMEVRLAAAEIGSPRGPLPP